MVGDGGGREEGETEGEDGRGEDGERFHEDVRDRFRVQEVRVELVSNSLRCQSEIITIGKLSVNPRRPG